MPLSLSILYLELSRRLGLEATGIAFPGHSAAADYVKEWKKYRPKSTPYKFGWGYGADLGGLSHQPDADKDSKLTYPFKGIDGKVTFERQKTGEE